MTNLFFQVTAVGVKALGLAQLTNNQQMLIVNQCSPALLLTACLASPTRCLITMDTEERVRVISPEMRAQLWIMLPTPRLSSLRPRDH